MFPDLSMLGIDLVIPDFDYLRQLGDRFRGFVITHGHEDHIGALPYALRDLKVPVCATPMAAGLIGSRLREHDLDVRPARVYRPRERWETRPVRHRPDPRHPLDRRRGRRWRSPRRSASSCTPATSRSTTRRSTAAAPTSRRFAEYGARGVLLLLSDSTNVEHAGSTGVGAQRAQRAGQHLPGGPRAHLLLDLLLAHPPPPAGHRPVGSDRTARVVVVGRSLVNSLRIATDLGYLRASPAIFADDLRAGVAAAASRHRAHLGQPGRADVGAHPHLDGRSRVR